MADSIEASAEVLLSFRNSHSSPVKNFVPSPIKEEETTDSADTAGQTPTKSYNLRVDQPISAERRRTNYLKARYGDFEFSFPARKSPGKRSAESTPEASPASSAKKYRSDGVVQQAAKGSSSRKSPKPHPRAPFSPVASPLSASTGDPFVPAVSATKRALFAVAAAAAAARTGEKDRRITPIKFPFQVRQSLSSMSSFSRTLPTTTYSSSSSPVSTNTTPSAAARQLQRTLVDGLNHLLRLPRARRWVYCEFFYAEMDKLLFLGAENEFSQCLAELFPNVRTRRLTRVEWRVIRQLIGKPRRCSAAFLSEEREVLEARRAAIRSIYQGECTHAEKLGVELPVRISQPLAVGDKVFVRIREPKDGVFTAVVDAVVEGRYRVVFTAVNTAAMASIPPAIVDDLQIMCERSLEPVCVNFFIERNRAVQAGMFFRSPAYVAPAARLLSQSGGFLFGGGAPTIKTEPADTPPAVEEMDPASPFLGSDPFINSRREQGSSGVGGGQQASAGQSTGMKAELDAGGDEELAAAAAAGLGVGKLVGHFQRSLLIAFVRLNKLLKAKRAYVTQLEVLNSEAERLTIFCDRMPANFQARYAQTLVSLEDLNRRLDVCVKRLLDETNVNLLPQLSGEAPSSSASLRPDALRKLSRPFAMRIVKHCASTHTVRSKRALELITTLTALLLQVKSLGQAPEPDIVELDPDAPDAIPFGAARPTGKVSSVELKALAESLREIKASLHPMNAQVFEENVEVHLSQIEHNFMHADALGVVGTL